MHATPYQVDPDRFQKQATALVDLLTQHFRELCSKPVLPSCQPGELAVEFGSRAPRRAREFEDILQTLRDKILPGVGHWQHPRFFAYYPSTSSIPAVLSELVIAGLGSVGLQWSANPIATELECIVMDWILAMLHAQPDSPFFHTSKKGGGLIQNTAGDALVTVMCAARVRKHLQRGKCLSWSELRPHEQEAIYFQNASDYVVYMSDQTHFSSPKAARVAGLRIHKIPARLLENGNYGLSAIDVTRAMDADRAAGLLPCCVLLNYGSTNLCGFDELSSFREMAQTDEVWIHIDAAYAGASLILPQFQSQSLAMQEVATSFNINGSKWFLCGFDSAFLFVRDRRLLKDVFSATGDYLADSAQEDVYRPGFKDWAVPLGRRFRALRIWMVLEYFGSEGIQGFLQQSIDQADWLRDQINRSDQFEQMVQTNLGLVCFRPLNQTTQTFLERLYALGGQGDKFLIYPSKLNDQTFIRVALGGTNTRHEDVEYLWQQCKQAAGMCSLPENQPD